VVCTADSCKMKAHICCLATLFLEDEPMNLLPTKGKCPSCEENLKWSEVISYKKKRDRTRETGTSSPKHKGKFNNEDTDKRKNTKTPFLQLQQHIYVRPQSESIIGEKRKLPVGVLTEVPPKRPRTVIQSLYS
jgi:hypothetical protein